MPPFQYPEYRDRFSGTIADIMQRRGDITASAALRRGQIESDGALRTGDIHARQAEQTGHLVAGAISGIGHAFSGAVTEMADPRRQVVQAQADAVKAERQGRVALAAGIKRFTTTDPDTGKIKTDQQQIANFVAQAGFPEKAESWLKMSASNASALDTLQELSLKHQRVQLETAGDLAFHATSLDDFEAGIGLAAQHGLIPEADALKLLETADAAGPDGWKGVQAKLLKFSPKWIEQQKELNKPRVLNEGDTFGVPGKEPIATGVPKKVQPTEAGLAATATDPTKTPEQRAAAQAALNALQAPAMAGRETSANAQAELARHNLEVEKIGRMTAGRAEASAAETARHNRAMEESARNRVTARPVIAGDAEDLANFDTALDDLKVLRVTIAPNDPKTGKPVSHVTGVGAQIGAAIPAWATDLTGWGTDAKKKQALIDRVKQVIGKTLEGGVLRKEDELKYEKILPTIKDTGEVVQSKLAGLEDAIAKRKGRRLDSLQDAGFNVDSFRSRTPALAVPTEGTEGTVNGRAAVWKTVNGKAGWYAK